jgi:hypothetical protein
MLASSYPLLMKLRFRERMPFGLRLLAWGVLGLRVFGAENPAAADFHRDIQPLLTKYCYDCHGDGAEKGKVAFDTFKTDAELLGRHDLWLSVLKNTRAGMMPPAKKPQPTAEELARLEHWIKAGALGLDPANPDPGHVTVRRLNRTEYRNTIKDLLGVDFDTQAEFPPDDTGRGFDNLGDVLTLPPMLLEKYLAAAQTIVTKAVPAVPAMPAERTVPGRDFHPAAGSAAGRTNAPVISGKALTLSYYAPALVTNVLSVTNGGRYVLALDFTANERFVDNVFDYNKCRFIFKADGEELFRKEFTREGNRAVHLEFTRDWPAGEHRLTIELEPLTPDQKQVRSLAIRLDSVTVRGPMAEQHWVKPEGYARFFPQDPPQGASARRKYARELLAPFVTRAYRRPVDDATLDRLVALAEATYQQPGKTFEAGIGQAMTAVLASPRFLFREEAAEPPVAGQRYPLVDEYALASRLSYFFWATMPDAELFRLAGEQSLRKNLDAQVRRMMADDRFQGFIRNFVGQWLQTRDIEAVSIDARQVLAREAAADPEQDRRRTRFRALRDKGDGKDALTDDEKKELEELRNALFRRPAPPLRAELTGDLRRAMRQETEKTFDYIVRENRSLKELLDGDYTFLNERLAKHYGLTNLNVAGDDLRRVTLPPGSPRGGILTQGTILAVTSNPTRTSPVKRGLFILDNILGTPPPPPPPDVSPLEDAAKGIKDRPVSLRETLALHREKPLCSSCHNRMDPLGLALENFNAMGMFRDAERSQPIDATGTLISGESFTDIRDLKHILATKHARDFYHTLTEKMLTYALGRGLEAYDVETVDQITDRLLKSEGKPAALFAGIVSSAPFQKTRATTPPPTLSPLKPVQQRADARLQP